MKFSPGQYWNILVVLVLLNFLPLSALSAEYLYDTCYMPNDFGNVVQRVLSVRPLGADCHLRCKDACSIFSRKNDSVELNDDIILKCMQTCRHGGVFNSNLREPSQDADAFMGFKFSTTPYSTTFACDTRARSPSNPYYAIQSAILSVKPSDSVRVRLSSPPEDEENEVYMCGWSVQYLVPAIDSLAPYTWSNNTGKWQARDNSPATWHARNHTFTDTGIDFRDGDYLSILYGGQYFSTPPYALTSDLDLRVKKDNAPFKTYGTQWLYDEDEYYVLPGSKIRSSKNSPDADISELVQLNQNLFFGLDGEHFELRTRMAEGLNFNNNMPQSNGTVIVEPFDNYLRFSGIVDNFSNPFMRLALAHQRKNEPTFISPFKTRPWNTSLGGYYVKIERKGCIQKNGKLLQYGIGENDPASDPKNPKYLLPNRWYDIPENTLSNFGEITIPTEGLLYFRIRPIFFETHMTPTYPSSDQDWSQRISAVQDLFTPINAHGQYTVLVERDDFGGAKSTSILSYFIDKLRGYLFGNNNGKGIVQNLFVSMLSDSGLVQAIRALMVLFIAYTGLSFILGIAQFTQKEGVVRLFKIGVLVTLISPGSWEFFSNTFFKFVIDGGLELLVRITASASKTPQEIAELLANPVMIFEEFNEPFRILFGRVTWLKVLALLVSSALGVIITLVVVFAGAIYALCIAKAALLYMVSMIGIAVLLTMAPIFISFLLFQYTKQMFESWWKQLLSLMLQPIMVYSFIFVINTLLLLCLKTCLGFSICYSCAFNLNLGPYGSKCLFSWYSMVTSMHLPDVGFALMMPIIATSLIFLILAQAMYAFTEWAAELAHMMATSQYQGALGNAVKSAISQTTQIASILTSTDEGLIAGGQAVRKNAGRVAKGGKWVKRNVLRR
jgi:type IV secretion system protein VirB6